MALERTDDDLVDDVSVALQQRLDQPRGQTASIDLHAFTRGVFARAGADDSQACDADGWARVLAQLLTSAGQRSPGTANVDVFNPGAGQTGEGGAGTVIQVVTDDSPFLVDTVSIAVHTRQLAIHAAVHPVFSVQRDDAGALTGIGEQTGQAESFMHFEIDRLPDAAACRELQTALEKVLAGLRAAVNDWQDMRESMQAIADDLPERRMPMATDDVTEAAEFLRWVADDHFTFLGYREYDVAEVEGEEILRAVEGSGLGILRSTEGSLKPRSLKTLVASQLHQSGAIDAIIVTRTNARAQIHRAKRMDYIGVLQFDADGKPIREQRFLGLFTTSAHIRPPQDVPLLRGKCRHVMERSGFRPDSYSGKTLRQALESLPRDELFQSSEDHLYRVAMDLIQLQERPQSRLFVRRDKYERFVSCLVFVPQARFTSTMRRRIEAMLTEAFDGKDVESNLLMSESALSRLHVTVQPEASKQPAAAPDDLHERLLHAVRNWHDDMRDCLIKAVGETDGAVLADRFSEALPAGYMEHVTAAEGANDVRVLDSLDAEQTSRMLLHTASGDNGRLRFKVYRMGGDISLSDVLPQLKDLGMRVHTERVDEMDLGSQHLSIQDLEVEPLLPLTFDVADVGPHFERAFENVWLGRAESDNFNQLVLGAFLDWRQVAMLRGYGKYLQQVGIAFSQSYMEETLNRYPAIANLLVELFNTKFDPQREACSAEAKRTAGKQLRRELETLIPEATRQEHPTLVDEAVSAVNSSRAEQIDVYWQTIKTLLDNVASLDDERIVQSYMDVIRATLRTSYFQTVDGEPRSFISYKFDPTLVPDMPKPVPYREIWVHGPRVEAVHLRFGQVARGGLRWSDRREDFRTEVLGLAKAQAVKNTVIVPVGSKGGFFVKQPPESGDRDAAKAEGKACYRLFVQGMLDITDNLDEDAVVPPADVVRHDGDDTYLVVAADKGTAGFSDFANAISAEHDYWLDDAFASGGSHGYDHKAMGITAKGGWESVKRHFRSLGHDCQSEDFTCVGVGDMSGDVFGNGMLLSEHTRLVGAFDHRHIFVDPDPDAAGGYAERKRLFEMPGSTWDHYDKSLISSGGGVWPRTQKSIPVSAEMRGALGLGSDVEELAPNALMSAILAAPVDMFWNGAIGTYVKSATETHADVGERANNGLRINGKDLRCRIVGEGGNLGFTQNGRIEAAQNGVILNTDFIDNSGGVDSSDREVNIKILLSDAVRRDELDFDSRNAQLSEMTEEVEQLVLWTNYRQNQAITLMEHMAVKRLGTLEHFIHSLEEEGRLDRQVEFLPDDDEIDARRGRGKSFTRPELAILLAYDKMRLYDELLDSDVPEDAYLSQELQRYFPEPLRQKFADNMQRHRLKREIIASAVTNSTINRMGATFMLRMQEDTGQTPAAVAKAFTAAREILDARQLWAAIEGLDNVVAEATQMDAVTQTWKLLRHMTRWLLNQPGGSLDIAANVERYAPAVSALREALPDALTTTGQADYALSIEKWEGLDVPHELAERLARSPVLRASLDMAEVSLQTDQPIQRVASVFFQLADALNLSWLRTEIEALPVAGRWHAQARGALLDELNQRHRQLAIKVLEWVVQQGDPEKPVDAWLQRENSTISRTRDTLDEIMAQRADYPIASVALRSLAKLVEAG